MPDKKKKYPQWIYIVNIVVWSLVLIGIVGGLILERETEEEKAARIANELAIAEEKALNKELLEEAINFVETGKCPDLKDDINRQLLFSNQFGTYVIDKAESDSFSFPKDTVPFNKKAWKNVLENQNL